MQFSLSLPPLDAGARGVRYAANATGNVTAHANRLAATVCSPYTYVMETVIHNVHDLGDNERSAAERLVGHSLRDDHRLIIQVIAGNGSTNPPVLSGEALPDWCNVYAGLTDAEIADIERSIMRSDSSRFVD
jgi:hypothetical protein